MASPNELIQQLKTSLPWRAWQRYSKARGGILAGGMAFIAFFSLLPALALGFTGFGLIVGDDPIAQSQVIEAVNSGIGTTIITPIGGSGGIIDLDTLLTDLDALTITGLIALAGFLFAGLSWLDAMREGIRAMFGRPHLDGNIFRTKARDILVLATIGVVLVASAVGGVVVSSTTGTLLTWVGLDGSLPGRLMLGAVTTLLLLAVDVLLFVVIFQLLSGVRVPRADLWDAALFGGIGFGVLKLFAGVVLNVGGSNPLLAVAGVLFGLLFWLNLICRLTLVAAAWGATVAIDRGHLSVDGTAIPLATELVPETSGRWAGDRVVGSGVGGSEVVDVRSGAGLTAAGLTAGRVAPAVTFTPVVSPRAADRVSVLAGAVLGAAGWVAARSAVTAARSVVDVFRRDD